MANGSDFKFPAAFMNAFDFTLGFEGVYSNDPDDPGGETFMGISRVNHPNWYGWEILDQLKLGYPTNYFKVAFKMTAIRDAVKYFYFNNFWNPINGDLVAAHSEEIAIELFDTAVNCGWSWASVILQRTLNLLNQGLFTDLVTDGKIGNKTLDGLWRIFKSRPYDVCVNTILLWMNTMQGQRYIEIVHLKPNQEKYTWGWAKRLQIVKKAVA